MKDKAAIDSRTSPWSPVPHSDAY